MFLVPAHPGQPGLRAIKRVCLVYCVHSQQPVGVGQNDWILGTPCAREVVSWESDFDHLPTLISWHDEHLGQLHVLRSRTRPHPY